MRFRQTTLQTTIGRSVSVAGVGVHTNCPSRLTLHPAEAGSGIVFRRTGFDGTVHCDLPALWSSVVSTELATRLGAPGRPSIGTVEHVLAALAGLGIDNAIVEVDADEAPILDGSAAPFVDAIFEAGLVRLRAPRRVIEILAPVRVAIGSSFAELRPAADGLTLDVAIDYADPGVGKQRLAMTLSPNAFRNELARARTFGFVADVERLWRAGFALGSSLDNALAFADGRVLNADGLRFPDECVRHKMLDAVGDLALAGAPIRGAFRSFRGGHRINHALLEALSATPSAWRIVEPGVSASCAHYVRWMVEESSPVAR